VLTAVIKVEPAQPMERDGGAGRPAHGHQRLRT
jgi:hypothetical protein